MKTQAIGIDLVDTQRVAKLYARYGERFARRILGRDELALVSKRRDKVAFLSGRFAAKEAAIKALGKYLSERPPFSQLQIINEPGGQPTLRFEGELAGELNHVRSLVSISHERTQAVAVVALSEES